MNLKKASPKIMVITFGLFMIGIMALSIFVGPSLQGSNLKQSTAKLPTSNIINYELDPNIGAVLMQAGATIISLKYNSNCHNCINQKSILESYAYSYNPTNLDKPTTHDIYGKIFLEELVDSSLNTSIITITSGYGQDTLVDANETGIFSSLCKLMVSPPVTCAFQAT